MGGALCPTVLPATVGAGEKVFLGGDPRNAFLTVKLAWGPRKEGKQR